MYWIYFGYFVWVFEEFVVGCILNCIIVSDDVVDFVCVVLEWMFVVKFFVSVGV